MFHPEILEQIKKEKFKDGFLYPFYGKYSIAELVPSIRSLFGLSVNRPTFPEEFFANVPRKNKSIITFILDGFGYSHFERYYKSLPFFDRLQKYGEVFPITSVFPSTTPAALTTIHTGLTPQEHGLPEWTVFFEEFDAIIEPIMFRRQKTVDRDGLMKDGANPKILFDGEVLYAHLAQSNIPSYYFIYEDYYPSAYSSITTQGSNVVAFRDGVDLMAKLRTTLRQTQGVGYFFVYWSFIDSVGHTYGPNSVQHTHALGQLSQLFENDFLQKVDKKYVKDTLLLLSADHGQACIRGEDIIYLGQYDYLNKNYSFTKSQQNILPTGAPHDVFLFIYPPKLEEIILLLKKDLEGKAEVLATVEAIKRGLFGISVPSEKFLKRVGNLLILPYPGIHIWYEHFPPETFQQLGTHGGLSEEEMVVPFAIAELKNLLN